MKNNKYKNDISKIEISANVKEKLFNKLNKKEKISLKYVFASIAVTLLVCIGVVNAETIKEAIQNIKGTTYKYTDGKEITTPEIQVLKTNYDDFVMKIDCESLTDNSCINYNSKENVLLEEAEKDIGVNILQLPDVDNYKVNYYLSENNSDNHPGVINIITNPDSNYIIHTNDEDKIITLSATIYTKNYIDSDKNIELNYNYEGKYSLDNGIKGYIDSYNFRNEKRNCFYFIYNNVKYELTGFNNVTNDELLNVAQKLK